MLVLELGAETDESTFWSHMSKSLIYLKKEEKTGIEVKQELINGTLLYFGPIPKHLDDNPKYLSCWNYSDDQIKLFVKIL